jgi:hypothetical protein
MALAEGGQLGLSGRSKKRGCFAARSATPSAAFSLTRGGGGGGMGVAAHPGSVAAQPILGQPRGRPRHKPTAGTPPGVPGPLLSSEIGRRQL